MNRVPTFLEWIAESQQMETKIFIDDDRQPVECVKLMKNRISDTSIYAQKDWIVIRTFGEFKRWVEENGLPTLISFDHDIAPKNEDREHIDINDWFDLEENREWNGVDCLKIVINYCLDHNCSLPGILIHSQNPVGHDNIEADVKRFKRYQEDGK